MKTKKLFSAVLFSYLILCTSYSSFSQVIAGGVYHSLTRCSDGKVRACGYNFPGQLGDGTNTDQSTPVQVTSLGNTVSTVAAGLLHSLFLKNDGTVWACGENADGQLGDGTNTSKNTPVLVTSLGTTVTAVAAGWGHSLFLKNDSTVWACGDNSFGELGDGTGIGRTTPVQVTSLGTTVTAIAVGEYHSLFLKNDGTVWACGDNFFGELGDGTNTGKNTPVQVSSLANTVTAVAAGGVQSLFLKNDSTVWACGDNYYGQLGDGTTTDRSTPVQMNTCLVVTGIPIEAVYIGNLEVLNIYPSFANDEVTALIHSEQYTIATAEAFNLMGQKVYEKNISLQKGYTKLKIPVSQWANGEYLFSITLPNKERVHKLFMK